MLDVGRGVLLAHQARDRVLELAAVDDDGGPVHRELVVVAGVVDVQMGVQDVADVLHLEAVLGELLLHALLVAPPAGHAEVAHDRRVAEARVDDDRRLAAGDEEAERRDLLRLSGLEREHEEARVELDVAQVEDLHFETHALLLGGWMRSGSTIRRARRRATIARSDEGHRAEQAALAGGVHGLGARRRVELAEEVARVGLGRRLADPEAPGDLLEAQALLEAARAARARARSARPPRRAARRPRAAAASTGPSRSSSTAKSLIARCDAVAESESAPTTRPSSRSGTEQPQ